MGVSEKSIELRIKKLKQSFHHCVKQLCFTAIKTYKPSHRQGLVFPLRDFTI